MRVHGQATMGLLSILRAASFGDFVQIEISAAILGLTPLSHPKVH